MALDYDNGDPECTKEPDALVAERVVGDEAEPVVRRAVEEAVLEELDSLTVPAGPVNNGVIYDYLRLELDEPNP